MDKFFNPKSVAVFGVSESPKNMAKNIVENLLEFGFKGIIYQIGRHPGAFFSRKIYTSINEIDDPIDLAIILTPASTVPKIMEECGKKGIKHIVIESAGFNEYGEEGALLAKSIIKIADKYGIRFIGPNCIGTIGLGSGLASPFVFIKNIFKLGGVSIISQSGGVGFSYLTMLASEEIGVSKFASIGNKLNVDENDLLEYLISDDETDIICMYLEGIKNGRRLMEIAQHSKKPILIQKANIGTFASSIAKSHTASLSSDNSVVSSAFKQSGIIRIADRETLINALKSLQLPEMRGNRLAILSRTGGHATIAADVSEIEGFELSSLSRSFLSSIEKHFRANVIKLTNPLDLGDLFDFDVYLQIIEKTLKQKNVDGVVFMQEYISETEGQQTRTLLKKVSKLSKKYDKPVGVCVATDADEFHKISKEVDFPIFEVPSAVIRALAISRDYYNGEKRAHRSIKSSGPVSNKKEAAKIIQSCKKLKRDPLIKEGMDIFSAYGIPVVKTAWVKNEVEAVKAAKKVGYPVAMKIVSREISHKTDFGGVKINIKNESHLIEEYREMMRTVKKKAPKAKIEGVVIQPMLKKGWEMILGAKQDPTFGPVVLAGLGGIFVEVFKDSAIRVAPFDKEEVGKMLSELKGYKILEGIRGQKPFDIASIEDTIIKLQRLIVDFPEIKEIDINPFYALNKGMGGFALDARIILG